MNKIYMAAYIAGFFDGEGSIFISKQKREDGRLQHRLFFSLTNTVKEPVQEAAKFLGINFHKTNYGPKNNIRYNIQVCGKSGLKTIAKISPFLISKKKQYALAILFEKRLKLGTKKLSNRELEIRDRLMRKIQDLNRGDRNAS